MARGHRLRGRDFPAPTETRRVGVAIVGGGVAGLSAAWKLSRSGFGDFRLFELEDMTGGNARSGRNGVSAYPWGAHYLPLPGREAANVRELLGDLGVISGDPHAQSPVYDERHLCFAPQERLYRDGLWQEGLLPRIGVTRRDLDQYQRFFALMGKYRQRQDASGTRAFGIPSALSARDSDLLALDRFSMRDFLLQQGLDSAPLHWYVDYACRDDYGSRHDQVSAWAGVHYFAGRNGRTENAESDQVLTWPEGNGWLTARLQQRLEANLTTGALVHRIENGRRRVEMDVFLAGENRTVRWQADALIFAAPPFVLPHVMEGLGDELKQAIGQIRHAPWLVANLTLTALPEKDRGARLSWDNVLYDSPALGYVNAMHQSLRSHPGPTVLTYYWALAEQTPEAARRLLRDTPRETWARRILDDLSRPHPDIRDLVERLDIYRWAHAMALPYPGWIWNAARLRLGRPEGRVHLAHSDLSGFSIFEEANDWGVRAAERVLRGLKAQIR